MVIGFSLNTPMAHRLAPFRKCSRWWWRRWSWNDDDVGENERPKNTEKFNIRERFKWNNTQLGEHMKGGRGRYILGMFEKSSIGGDIFLLAGTYLEWNVGKTKQTPPLSLTWQCVSVSWWHTHTTRDYMHICTSHVLFTFGDTQGRGV